MTEEHPFLPEEDKRDKTVGGLSEASHRGFNTLKYRYGFANADTLLSEMMEICETVGLLGNTALQESLKEVRDQFTDGSEMVKAMIAALEGQKACRSMNAHANHAHESPARTEG